MSPGIWNTNVAIMKQPPRFKGTAGNTFSLNRCRKHQQIHLHGSHSHPDVEWFLLPPWIWHLFLKTDSPASCCGDSGDRCSLLWCMCYKHANKWHLRLVINTSKVFSWRAFSFAKLSHLAHLWSVTEKKVQKLNDSVWKRKRTWQHLKHPCTA